MIKKEKLLTVPKPDKDVLKELNNRHSKGKVEALIYKG